jgi:choline dehydrogenase
MLYNRGDANDYENWAQTVKDDEWSADNVLSFFKMSEDDSRGASKYHGIGGEFNVSDVRYQNPLSKAFLAVCGENGLPANDDFNDWSRSQEGYGRYQVNEKEGSRCSTASGFLAPAMKRRNLTVVSNAVVTKVTFIGTEATGVDAFIDNCRQHIVLKHDGEIILTAGAVSNPQILLLSGIGPRSHMHHYGVADIVELPGVGKNLQDQATALVTYECIGGNEGTSLTSVTRIPGTALQNPKAVLEYMVTKSGPFTSPGPDHGAFFKTKEKLASPDLQIKFVAAVSSRADGLKLISSKVRNLNISLS